MLARLRKSEFVANVAKVFAGNGLVLAISLFAIPVISRLYTPDDYGVVGLIISIAAVATVFATLKYEMALVLPKEDDTARHLLHAALTVVVLVSAFVAIAVVIARACCTSLEALTLLGNYIWWIPIIVFLMASLKLLVNGWLVRQKQFGRMTIAEMSSSLVNLSIRIGLGFLLGSTVWGLVAGLVVGMLVGILVAMPFWKNAFSGRSESSFFGVLKEYPEFPKYTMPADFVRTFAQNLPVIMFGFMYSPAVAGLFYMANRLIKAPVELGLHAFRGVFLQKVSAMHSANKPLRATYVKTVASMFVLGLVPAFILFSYGTEILTFVLGDKWKEAGRFAEILAPLLMSFWITSPAAMLLITLRHQNYWLAVQATIAALQTGVFVYAYYNQLSPTTTLSAFVVVQLVVNLFLKVLVLILLGRNTAEAAVQ